jgi:hypothetical protein
LLRRVFCGASLHASLIARTLRGHSRTLPSSALPRPACHELTHSPRPCEMGGIAPRWRRPLTGSAWCGGKERSRAELRRSNPTQIRASVTRPVRPLIVSRSC